MESGGTKKFVNWNLGWQSNKLYV